MSLSPRSLSLGHVHPLGWRSQDLFPGVTPTLSEQHLHLQLSDRSELLCMTGDPQRQGALRFSSCLLSPDYGTQVDWIRPLCCVGAWPRGRQKHRKARVVFVWNHNSGPRAGQMNPKVWRAVGYMNNPTSAADGSSEPELPAGDPEAQRPRVTPVLDCSDCLLHPQRVLREMSAEKDAWEPYRETALLSFLN